LLHIFTSVGICPNVLKRNGNLLLVIEIVEANVRIVSSNNYIPGNEFDLADFFDISYIPHFFPYQFLVRQSHSDTEPFCIQIGNHNMSYSFNWNYNGPRPDFKYFLLQSDTKKTHKEKLIFYQKIADPYCISKELQIHADLKLHLLSTAMMHFLKESFQFQQNIHIDLQNESLSNFVNPFNAPIVSLGSLMYNIYSVNFMEKYNIYSVKNEYGTNLKQVSRLEHQFVMFQHYRNPGTSLISAFSSENGQKYFRESVPDLYCEQTKQCWYLMGCVIHGHMDGCLLNPNANAETKNPFGKPYGELNSEFQTKLDNLILNNPTEVKEIILEWECLFRQKMRTNSNLMNFIDHHYVSHPLTRLKPRSTVRSGLLDCYAMKWGNKHFPNENFYALDVNGLYSFCGIKFPYMTGKFKVIIGEDLKNITISNNCFFYCGDKIMGSVLLQILPPKDLKYPFLMYRVNDQNFNTLCAKCAELQTKTKCKHSDSQRALISTYMISEVEFALSLKYSILAVFEIHAYFTNDYILEPFVKQLSLLKLLHSDCIKPHLSTSDKQDYCEKVNLHFNLSEAKSIKPKSFKPNIGRRNFYKLACNTFFGKWSQRTDKGKIAFVSTQQELEKYLVTDKVDDVFCLSENVCMVQTSCRVPTAPNLKYNVYIGAQIAAYGRQVIYSHLQSLLTIPNCTIYQINCDSIYFSLPKNVISPFQTDQLPGTFKDVYNGKILSFMSFGPRQYCIHFENDNTLKTETRISGLSINQEISNFDFNAVFDELITKYENECFHQFVFPQTRKRILKNLVVKKYSEKFSLTNSFSNRRRLCLNSSRIETLPYGYTDTDA